MKNLAQMMKQAQQMQEKMAEMQAKLEEQMVEGQAAAGMVKITMTAKGLIKSVNLDPSLLNPEEAEILEDLIMAAHNDAKAKAETLMQEEMSSLTGGLNLPEGFKMPF